MACSTDTGISTGVHWQPLTEYEDASISDLDHPAEDGGGATWACTGERTPALCHCPGTRAHDDVSKVPRLPNMQDVEPALTALIVVRGPG